MENGNLWISRDGGEGMELNKANEEKLATLISLFWNENF
jgi:hypothetical protein